MASSDHEQEAPLAGESEEEEQDRPHETWPEMRARHNREMRNLMDRRRAQLKNTRNKAKSAELVAQFEQERLDMEYRHKKEEEELEEWLAQQGGAAAAVDDAAKAEEAAREEQRKKEQAEKEAAERRIAKAQRKRDKKAAKEAERERLKEEINKSVVDMRGIELEQINNLLRADGLQVKEVMADGHCMYRAVADQLRFVGQSDMNEALYARMRSAAAAYMREHRDDFNPFLGLSDEEYAAYCDKVENTAEWGGQLELRALSSALQRPIWVFAADAPLLRMGDEFEGVEPLKVTFHRHYYALGEHYNSVTRLAS